MKSVIVSPMTAKISKEAVAKLASLSRISVPEERLEAFSAEIDSILEYVSQIQTIVKDADPAVLAAAAKSVPKAVNAMRDDVPARQGGEFHNLVDAAPRSHDGAIEVTQMFS